MLKKTTRSMTAEERSQLEDFHQLTEHQDGCVDRLIAVIFHWGGGMVVGMFVGAGIGLPFYLLWPRSGIAGTIAVAGMVVGTIVGAVILYRSDQSLRTSQQAAIAACATDLAEGVTEVLEADVYDAVVVEEVEDEGPSAFLDVGNGQVLALQGQWLRDFLNDDWRMDSTPGLSDLGEAQEQERTGGVVFPSQRIRLSQAPRSGLAFRFECLGDPLLPSRVLDPSTEEWYWPEQTEILRIQFDQLESELHRLWQERGGA
jgi:hypothetical protein